MSENKTPRPIAGDVGTDSRIDREAGHYWVRLWSREAIRREGDAMVNCLHHGGYDSCAGSDHAMNRLGNLWSLRDRDGSSVALADVAVNVAPGIRTFLGPKNAMPSSLAYRQIERLLAFYMRVHGCELKGLAILDEPCVVAPDGSTYRWDRAPKALRRPDYEERLEARRRAHEEAKARREAAGRRRENQPPIPEGGQAIAIGVDFQDPNPRGIANVAREGDEIVVSLTDGTELRLPWQSELQAMQASLDRGVIPAEAVARAYRNVAAFRANLSRAIRRRATEDVDAGRRIVGETVEIGRRGARLNRQANGLFRLWTGRETPFICHDLRIETTSNATEARVTCIGRTFDLANGATVGGTEFQFELSPEDYRRLVGEVAANGEPEAVEVEGEITYDAWQHAVQAAIDQGLGL